MTFSRRSTYSQRASSSTNVLFSEGSAVKSKLSRLLTAGNLASLIRRSTIRRRNGLPSRSPRLSRGTRPSHPRPHALYGHVVRRASRSNGHPGPPNCGAITLAEWLCREADWLDPSGVPGSHRDLGRG